MCENRTFVSASIRVNRTFVTFVTIDPVRTDQSSLLNTGGSRPEYCCCMNNTSSLWAVGNTKIEMIKAALIGLRLDWHILLQLITFQCKFLLYFFSNCFCHCIFAIASTHATQITCVVLYAHRALLRTTADTSEYNLESEKMLIKASYWVNHFKLTAYLFFHLL